MTVVGILLYSNLVSASNIRSYFSIDEQGVEVTVYYIVCGADQRTDLTHIYPHLIIEDPVDGTEPKLGKVMIFTRPGKPLEYKCLRIGKAFDTVSVYFWDLHPDSEYQIEVNGESRGSIHTP